MAKDKRQTKDQKRKKKLIARAKAESNAVTAYDGSTYQAPKYVQLMAATESAIHEADVSMGRTFKDRHVEDSLKYLIRRMRGEEPDLPSGGPRAKEEGGTEQDAVAWSIQRRWTSHMESVGTHYSDQVLVGILRTLLGSIPVWTSKRGPRGYLDFIEGFLAKRNTGTRGLTPEILDVLDALAAQEQAEDMSDLRSRPITREGQLLPLAWPMPHAEKERP